MQLELKKKEETKTRPGTKIGSNEISHNKESTFIPDTISRLNAEGKCLL